MNAIVPELNETMSLAAHEQSDMVTRKPSFDIRFLAARVEVATDWAPALVETYEMKIGYFVIQQLAYGCDWCVARIMGVL
jgi:hypothetical protein